MGVIKDIIGNITGNFQFGIGGPRIKRNGTALEARNAADNALANLVAAILTANGVSVTALRAKDALRARYLDAHATRAISRNCRRASSAMLRLSTRSSSSPAGESSRCRSPTSGQASA